MSKELSKTYSFTFLIVNFNGYKSNVLVNCLSSITNHVKVKSQVIVVDNNSTDESSIYCNLFKKNTIHDLVLIQLDMNYGPSYARYKALEYIEGFVTVILDNDAELTDSSLNGILECYYSNPKLAIVQPLLIIKASGLVDYAGDFITKIGVLSQNVEPLSAPSNISSDKTNSYILSAKSAGMFIRTSSLVDVGGFDPWFFMYVEETDLGWKCWNNGYFNVAKLDNIILHAYGSSSLTNGSNVVNFNSAFYGTRNYLAVLYLNEFGISMIIRVLSCLFFWIIFDLSCILRGEFYRAKYSFLGIIAFFVNLPLLRQKKALRIIPSYQHKMYINSKIYRSIPLLNFYKKFFRRPIIGNSVKWK